MIKDNRWRLGTVNLSFPAMSQDLMKQGCSFYGVTLDKAVGEEITVFFREDPPYAKALGKVQPMTLVAHKGIVATPFGVVAYIVWRIAAGTAEEVLVETYLNPFEFGTLKLVSNAANQTNLKFIAVDRSTQEVVQMIDFENTFDLDALLFHMAMNIGHSEMTDFAAATDFIRENSSVEQLVQNAKI